MWAGKERECDRERVEWRQGKMYNYESKRMGNGEEQCRSDRTCILLNVLWLLEPNIHAVEHLLMCANISEYLKVYVVY